jgi:hypothetical protein
MSELLANFMTPLRYNRIMERLEDRLNLQTQSHKTAIRTLNWIACAERPLKKHELQHGICLYPDNNNNVVTDGTKPSRRVFDLCKPLLEDGPNDTVRFVHSSVKQYVT